MVEVSTNLPDGIYFGLPFRDYAAQDRLSASALSKLNIGPLKYYEDVVAPRLDPDFDLNAHLDEATESQAEGRAWHDMTIEGPEVFWQRNAIAFDPAAFPGALKSKDDYIAQAKASGVSDKGTMATIKAAIQESDVQPSVGFYDDLKAEHEADNKGKHMLTEKQYEQIKRAGEIVDQYQVRDAYLFGGFPEVSILFTLRGVRFKIRIDYLRPDLQLEYKTTANKLDKILDEAVVDSVANYQYLTGAFLYTEGVKVAVKQLKAQQMKAANGVHVVTGQGPSTEWLENFKYCDDHKYWFLFQQRGKYNHCLMREVTKYDHNHAMRSLWKTGKLRTERAVTVYNWYMENNGLEKRWLPDINPKAFDDVDFKPWQLEE